MEFQPRDLLTIVGGVVSLTGLYYALKRDVVKVSTSLKTVESYHKREVTMLAESIKDTKDEFNAKLNIMKDEQNKAIDKLEKKIDVIAAQNLSISNNLAELAGYISVLADRIRKAIIDHGIPLEYRSFQRMYQAWRSHNYGLEKPVPTPKRVNGNLSKLENHFTDFGNMVNE